MVAIGRQMNGSYASEWYDACAVMMRRLLEAAIIEAFEAKKIDSKIKDTNGDFFQLTALISAALAETAWNLSRNVKSFHAFGTSVTSPRMAAITWQKRCTSMS